MATILTKRVIVEAHQAELRHDGDMTIGQQVDEYIKDALKLGNHLTSVEVHIGDLEWEQLLHHEHNGTLPSSAVANTPKKARASL
jgi:hypothetical protein